MPRVACFGRGTVQKLAFAYLVLVACVIFSINVQQSRLPPASSGWLHDTTPVVKTHSREGSDDEALALLYPPGLIGGYRNQVLRFIAFVAHGKKENISQLLLPTILWTTQYEASGSFLPIAMDEVFDITHWNSFFPALPRLVDSIPSTNASCWQRESQIDSNQQFMDEFFYRRNQSSFFHHPLGPSLLTKPSFLAPVENISRFVASGLTEMKFRKVDYLPELRDCQRPRVYGGGKGAGRLWNDYLRLEKTNEQPMHPPESLYGTNNLVRLVSNGLLLAPKWRSVANGCVTWHQKHLSKHGNTGTSRTEGSIPYVALHARVEVDMMIHKCGKAMEKNLTRILGMVESFVSRHNEKSPDDLLQGTFIAVSRSGMLEKTSKEHVQEMADENYKLLLERSANESAEAVHIQDQFQVFECGELWMNRWYKDNNIASNLYGSLIPSAINFFIATHASIFIGVAKSSWSTDVWTTRYYQGRGEHNFEYTPQGIRQLANSGLPPPHKNC